MSSKQQKTNVGKQTKQIEVITFPLKLCLKITSIKVCPEYPTWGTFVLEYAVNGKTVGQGENIFYELEELKKYEWVFYVPHQEGVALSIKIHLRIANEWMIETSNCDFTLEQSYEKGSCYGEGTHNVNAGPVIFTYSIAKLSAGSTKSHPDLFGTVLKFEKKALNSQPKLKIIKQKKSSEFEEQSVNIDSSGKYRTGLDGISGKCQLQIQANQYKPSLFNILKNDWKHEITLPLAANYPGKVIMGFEKEHFPSWEQIGSLLSGFDDWGVFTLDQAPSDMSRFGNRSLSTGSALEVVKSSLAPVEVDNYCAQEMRAAIIGGGTGMAARSAWPYFYRILQKHDVANILVGKNLQTIKSRTWVPASSRMEMTYRHTRAGGNVFNIGTDRISLGKNYEYMLGRAKGGWGTQKIVRINPELGNAKYLSTVEILKDLRSWEAKTQMDLNQILAQGGGKGKVEKFQTRLNATRTAIQNVKKFQEVNAASEVPLSAISKIKNPQAELNAMRLMEGIRVVGGVLMIYGAYKSIDRIVQVMPEERPRVAVQEVGGWAGGIAGATVVGELFAVGSAALGLETGPGAVILGLAGGIIGGLIGGIAGCLGADWVYSLIEDQNRSINANHLQFGGGSFGGGGASGSW